MTFQRSHGIWVAMMAIAALLTGGMAFLEPEGETRMSGMHVASLAGYSVSDWNGEMVGTIASVETDDQGRTRWLNIDLNGGGNVRIASFRADLDASHRNVSVRLPDDVLLARAN